MLNKMPIILSDLWKDYQDYMNGTLYITVNLLHKTRKFELQMNDINTEKMTWADKFSPMSKTRGYPRNSLQLSKENQVVITKDKQHEIHYTE